MLSQENVDKLCVTGVYRCEPVLSWLPYYKRDNPYWCRNWTFTVHERNGEYYMYDTYWLSGDEYPVKLTDENFDKFEFLFDLKDAKKFTREWSIWITYDEKDRWHAAMGSCGISEQTYYVRKGSKPVKELVLKRLQSELDHYLYLADEKRRLIQRVENDEIDLEYA